MPTSPMQALPYPAPASAVNIPGDMAAMANAIEPRLVMWFSNAAARDAAILAPSEGMMCFLDSNKNYYGYTGGDWRVLVTAGITPGSGRSHGKIISHSAGDISPANLSPGTLFVDRDQVRLRMINAAGVNMIPGAAPLMAWAIQRHGGGGIATSPDTSSLAIGITITTTSPNQALRIMGMIHYNQMGTSGLQEMRANLLVTPPAGGASSLMVSGNRDNNSSGVSGKVLSVMRPSWRAAADTTARRCWQHEVRSGRNPVW